MVVAWVRRGKGTHEKGGPGKGKGYQQAWNQSWQTSPVKDGDNGQEETPRETKGNKTANFTKTEMGKEKVTKLTRGRLKISAHMQANNVRKVDSTAMGLAEAQGRTGRNSRTYGRKNWTKKMIPTW